MGITLQDKQISATYDGLIKFGDNLPVTASLKILSDGQGNDLPVRISASELEIPVGNTITVEGTIDVTNATVVGLTTTDISGMGSYATITYVNTQVGNEETARITADGLLQDDIDANATDIATLQTDFLTLDGEVDDLQNGVGNVTSFNTLTGAVTISAGNNITFDVVGNDIEINSSGGGGGGSNDFGRVASTGQPDIVAQSGNDTLNIEKASNQGITISNDNATTTMTLGTDSAVLTYRTLFDPVSAQVTTNVSDISSLDGRVTTNEGDIATLQAATHVDSLNTLTGDVTISAGTNITFDTVGNNIEINASGGGGSTTINNNANNRIITGSDTADTLEAEAKFTYDGTNIDIIGAGVTDGLRITGGNIGGAAPSLGLISGSNFNRIDVKTDLVLQNQAKIAFDSDPTNTYIAADTQNPENLQFHADADLQFYPDNAFEVYTVAVGSTKVFNVDSGISNARVSIGYPAVSGPRELNVVGGITFNEDFFDHAGTQSSLAWKGETINLGISTVTTAGKLYYYTGTSWALADADVLAAASSLLAIAVSTTSAKGMLINGWYEIQGGFSNGQIYMSATAGDMTATQPSTSGQYVRVVGHGTNTTLIRFNPSNDFYEVE
jgi:hypothetical protein